MKTEYTIKCNREKKTYTIRRYDDGRLTSKYRSTPQGADFTEDWTEDDIKAFLRHGDYYRIK